MISRSHTTKGLEGLGHTCGLRWNRAYTGNASSRFEMEDLKSEVKLSYTTGGFSVASSLPGVGESFGFLVFFGC